MSVRSFVGDKIRKVIGNSSYIRLRHGYRAEHSYLSRVQGVIHVGANEGQERELYAAFGLHVIWIEPIPEVCETLELNLSNFPKQHAYNYLVTDEDGKEYQFHIADNAGASSSILELNKHAEMYPHIAYKGSVILRGTTLNSILSAEQVDIRRYDAMVLDTQGSELKILRGAAELLPNFKFVKVEVPDFESYKGCCQIGELAAFMALNGFRERSQHPIIHTPGIGTYFEVIYKRIAR